MPPPRICLPLPAVFALLGATLLTAKTTIEQWDTLTLDFPGPEAGETGELNPFTDIRLEVTFTHEAMQVSVPGFYAADAPPTSALRPTNRTPTGPCCCVAYDW